MKQRILGAACAARALLVSALAAALFFASVPVHGETTPLHGSLRGDDPVPLAPDGQRGLGAETTLGELQKMLRARRGDDAEFIGSLRALEGSISRHVSALKQEYSERGYFELLLPSMPQEVRQLHAVYLAARDDLTGFLDDHTERAEVLGRLLADTRFNVRLKLLQHADEEASELRRGLDVLRGTTDGYVILIDDETRAIVTRVDIAASALRALGSDLAALRPKAGRARIEEPPSELERELLEVVRLPADTRGAALERALNAANQLEDRMGELLAWNRLVPKLGTLHAWRAAALAQAALARDEAFDWLPDGDDDDNLPREIRESSKTDRMRSALFRAQQGLVVDPLDPELAWVSATAMDFQWGGRESRPYYDRYLALVGIRSHDHRTLKDRKLTKREQEALATVQSGL